jgi:hypothetical protein
LKVRKMIEVDFSLPPMPTRYAITRPALVMKEGNVELHKENLSNISHLEKMAREEAGIIADEFDFYDSEEEARRVVDVMLRDHPHLELFIWNDRMNPIATM